MNLFRLSFPLSLIGLFLVSSCLVIFLVEGLLLLVFLVGCLVDVFLTAWTFLIPFVIREIDGIETGFLFLCSFVLSRLIYEKWLNK